MVKPKICLTLPKVIAEIKVYIKTHPRISPLKKNSAAKSPLIKHTMKITKQES